MKFDGIDGDVSSTGHEKWIECQSFQFGIGRGIGSPTGSEADRESSQPSVSEIVVSKNQDSSSRAFFSASLAGEGKKVTIDFTRTKQDAGQETYLSIELENTLVSGYSMSSGGDRPSESVSLNFTKITYAYTPAGADLAAGSTDRGSYNLSTNEVG